MSMFVRKAVSKNKRRYKKNGFDLDLSYITDRLIAMGFPSESVEGVYRNPMKEVFRFLETYHKERYKVYNLCSERSYDISKFHNRVECFPFDDHNAPPLDLVWKFCKDVEAWLAADSKNVAVIHCKAGKGRTGLMICSFMLYSKEWEDAESALNFYAAMRTYNQKGVTIPSQLRYVRYFAEIVNNLSNLPEGAEPLPKPRTLLLQQVVLTTVPKVSVAEIRFTISINKTLVYTSKEAPKIQPSTAAASKEKDKEKTKKKSSMNLPDDDDDEDEDEDSQEEDVAHDLVIFDVHQSVPVSGDIKVEFSEKSGHLFAFWLNTAFVPTSTNRVELVKEQLDKANKDKFHKVYRPEFKVSLAFKPLHDEDDHASTTLAKKINATAGLGSSHNNNNNNGAAANGGHNKDFVVESTPLVVKEKVEPALKLLNTQSTCTSTFRSACTVSEELLKKLIEVVVTVAKATDGVVGAEALPAVASSKEFEQFTALTVELQKVDTVAITNDEKLAFWLNTYNLLQLHSSIVTSNIKPKETVPHSSFSHQTGYVVGGSVYTLALIEFAILRNKLRNSIPSHVKQHVISLYGQHPSDSDDSSLGLAYAEPRLLFGMCDGTRNSPSIRIFHPLSVFEELERVVRLYLQQHASVDESAKVVNLPQLLEWYGNDFGKTPEKVLRSLLEYLPTKLKQQLIPVLAHKGAVKVAWIPYQGPASFSFQHFITSSAKK